MAIWQLALQGHQFGGPADSPYRQLLTRLERIDDRCATRLVEQTLSIVAVAALDDREASFVEEPPGTFKLVPESLAGRLWIDLAIWEVGNPRRKASLRRALAHAWEILGDLQDGPVSHAQWAPLALANDVLVQSKGAISEVPSPDAVVAVMSALWKQRPLSWKKVLFNSLQEGIAVDLEELLSFAARSAPSAGAPAWSSDGTAVSFQYAPKGGDETVEVSVPAEAVMLRMAPASAAQFAAELAFANGIRDGRLYRALMEFAKVPDDKSRRKYLARAACSAPFRLVADDPRFLLCFGDRAAVSQHGYPASIEELREMLSEPEEMFSGPLQVEPESALPEEFLRRLKDGVWSTRIDRPALVHFASRVPGRLPALAAHSVFDGESDKDLKEAADALDRSRDMTIGNLAIASAFAILTWCSNRPAELKESMSQALAGALRREFAPGTAPSLAHFEPVIMQAVGRVVTRFAPWGMPEVEHAWLTSRLYEWWLREAQTSDVCSLFKPDANLTWHRFRAEVVLNVILDVLEAIVVKGKNPPQFSETLTLALKEILLGDEANPFEAARRPGGWLYWRRPQGCGWLASSVLLWVSPDTFFDMRPEMRLAILEKLPRTKADAAASGISHQPVIRALGRAAARLTQPELDALQAWLDQAESSDMIDLWRADLLAGLVASRGDRDAAARLRSLASGETLRSSRPELVGSYIEVIALARLSEKLSDMEHTVLELLETVWRIEHGKAAIRAGLRLAMARPANEAVREILQCLVGMPELSPGISSLVKEVLASEGAATDAGAT
jgi:hypothetical protein